MPISPVSCFKCHTSGYKYSAIFPLWCSDSSGSSNPGAYQTPYWMSLYQNDWYHFTETTLPSDWITTELWILCATGQKLLVQRVPLNITKTLRSQNSSLLFLSMYFILSFFFVSPPPPMSYSTRRFLLAIPFIFSFCVLGVRQRKVKLCKGCLLFAYVYLHVYN